MQVIKKFFLFLPALIVIFYWHAVQANDVFTIEDIWVDQSSSNATMARNLAISEAERIAFDKLMRSIITDEGYYNLPVLSKEEISALVKGFEVAEEKITRKTYNARFSISFFPHLVKKLLEENEIVYVENKGLPTLILPVYQQGNDIILWETEANPWWVAWSNVVSENNVIPMVMPLGDIEDLKMLNVEDVYSADYSVLSKIAEKYAAKNVLIVEAQYDDRDFSGKPALEVVLKLVEEDTTEKRRAHYDGDYTSNREYLLNSAVNDLIGKIENDWLKKAKQLAATTVKKELPNITVDIPINNLKHWMEIKEKISKMDIVKKLEVIGLSSAMAKIKLSYQEDFATFSYFLGVAGFNLRKVEETDSWFLETN